MIYEGHTSPTMAAAGSREMLRAWLPRGLQTGRPPWLTPWLQKVPRQQRQLFGVTFVYPKSNSRDLLHSHFAMTSCGPLRARGGNAHTGHRREDAETRAFQLHGRRALAFRMSQRAEPGSPAPSGDRGETAPAAAVLVPQHRREDWNFAEEREEVGGVAVGTFAAETDETANANMEPAPLVRVEPGNPSGQQHVGLPRRVPVPPSPDPLVQDRSLVRLERIPPVGLLPKGLPGPEAVRVRIAGEPTVDVLLELTKLGDCPPALTLLLSYLSPKDLCRVCVVSQAWRQAVLGDPCSDRRRKRFLEECRKLKKQMGKENVVRKSFSETPSSISRTGKSSPCKNLSNTDFSSGSGTSGSSETPYSPSKRKFLTFFEAGRRLNKDEHLTPCPHCSSPARVDRHTHRAECTGRSCHYYFCSRCLTPPHPNNPCSSVQGRLEQSAPVGSSKSRRNLRRL
ncbi:unnamed protein product [Darwinula stevensoni]|uniref:ZBR-type domain-containing protein n=1 Tax=Darwinula stevensoni TaxID=69355 RepID=A0A7R9A8R1_9CRUS|nr:unnamed protein product [Darwinula stevensoni]CAG0896630.1 unnamed protein product [Darwinula stevensoni]